MCKLHVKRSQSFNLSGAIAVTAGLFYGGWVPPLAEVVGKSGLVYGFEPGAVVRYARATVAGNGLGNITRIHHGCLSNVHSKQKLCVRDWRGQLLGGLQAVISEDRNWSNGHEWTKHPCNETEQTECFVL